MHLTEFHTDFDRLVSLSEKAQHDALLAANDAFVAAMMKQIRSGRETIKPGTITDETPLVVRASKRA